MLWEWGGVPQQTWVVSTGGCGEWRRVTCKDVQWRERESEERKVGEKEESTCALAARERGERMADTGTSWPWLPVK